MAVGLQDVRGLPDPLDTEDFLFTIPAMPVGSARHLEIKCKTVDLPGFGTEKSLSLSLKVGT